MRTTIRLDDELLKSAKQLAAATGRTLNDVVEEALREKLARRKPVIRREPVVLPTFAGRLRPGIDLDDSAALLDLMDATDAVD
jgi:hypothetical protein